MQRRVDMHAAAWEGSLRSSRGVLHVLHLKGELAPARLTQEHDRAREVPERLLAG